MDTDIQEPTGDFVAYLLDCAFDLLSRLPQGEAIARQGGAFGDPANDTELRADLEIGTYLRIICGHGDGVGLISIEGREDFVVDHRPFWIAIDPLDGSLNYRMRDGAIGLPYTTCVTMLGRREQATFADVVAAGVIDLRSRDTWVAYRADDGYRTFVRNQKHRYWMQRAAPRPEQLDLGSQIVIGEFYYPENREKLVRAFAGKKGWLRNPGSSAYEMAMVAHGTAVAFISDQQKQHELGAGYALVKGAGGVAVDWDGNDLGSRTYDFKTQTPVVLAVTQPIADQILSLLRS